MYTRVHEDFEPSSNAVIPSAVGFSTASWLPGSGSFSMSRNKSVTVSHLSSSFTSPQSTLAKREHDFRSPTAPVRLAWLPRLVLLAGGGVATLGVLVLIGWHIRNPTLIRVSPTAAPMYYNTALSFTLCGVSLLAGGYGWNRLAHLAGGLVAALGSLTLSEHFFGVDLGIDQALMTDWVRFGSLPPGRMAGATALGFTLSGLMLLTLSTPMSLLSARRAALIGISGTVVTTLGLGTLGLYLTNLMAAEGWGQIAQVMAVHTAVGMGILGVGSLAWVWHRTRPVRAPSWLPAVAGASIVTATLLLWQALLVQQHAVPPTAPTALSAVLLEGGLLVAVFVTLTVFLAQRARQQAWETTAANRALQQEIEARAAVEATLRESEERFLLFMDHNPAIAWMKDEQGRYVYLNQTYEQRFGVRLADWRGKTDAELWPPDVAEVFRKNDQAVLAAGTALEVEENTPNPDGAQDAWWNFKFPFQDAAGKKYVAGLGLDVTAQKAAEETLRTLNAELEQRVQERTAALVASEARFRRVVDSNLTGIDFWELETGRILDANDALLHLLGYTREDFLAGHIPWQDLTPPEWLAQDRQKIAEVKAVGFYPPYEKELLRRDGQRLTILIGGAQIPEAPGEVVSFILDITARKQAEEARAQHARDLARAHADLRQVSYASAHDLQEPVRQLSLYTQKLAKRYRDSRDAETIETMEFIIEGATRMQAQFTDLMHYLDVDERGHGVTSINCELLLHQALEKLREPLAVSGAIVTHDPLPTVAANATQLQLVFQELLDNALKFRHSAPPRVHVWAEREKAGWRFAIRDNGIGIKPQSVGQLFRFFGKLQRRTAFPGTGMGLAICKKIIERHGGRIWVNSQSEEGTTIYFTISESVRGGK